MRAWGSTTQEHIIQHVNVKDSQMIDCVYGVLPESQHTQSWERVYQTKLITKHSVQDGEIEID